MEEEYQKGIKMYRYYMCGSLIYALFFTFCLYKNGYGILYPFFTAGTILVFYLFLKRRDMVLKKDSIFYIICIMLLGISTCLTANKSIIAMNKAGIFILMFCFIIHQFYMDTKWSVIKYTSAVLQTICGTIISLERPFKDTKWYTHTIEAEKAGQVKENSATLRNVLWGLLISIPLLVIILLLLSSADFVFHELLSLIIKDSFIELILRNAAGVIFLTVFAFFACYCTWVYLCKKSIDADEKSRNNGQPVIAITFTSIVSVIYVLFSGIQIVYLFFGKMELPQKYTYAEYAREGFFQLLFVCLLNLALVLLCLFFFQKHPILKGILTVISICTFIMILSSAMRMWMYIKAYHLSFLRIFVLWSLFVIFLLMLGITISIFRDTFPLFRYSMVAVTICYLALSFSHQDYWIARYNLSYAESENKIDYHYLKCLSTDAAPVILSEEIQKKYPIDDNAPKGKYSDENWIQYYILFKVNPEVEKMNIRSFNFSVNQAKMQKILD